MSSEVKGTLLLGLVDDLRVRLDQGELDADVLESRLSVDALKLLSAKPVMVGWYPIQVYRELLDAHVAAAGKGRPDQIRGIGQQAAYELVKSGLYKGFVKAGQRRSSFSADSILANAQRVLGMNRLMYRGVEVDAYLEEEAQTLNLHYWGVSEFSDAMFYSTHGFINGMSVLILGEPDALHQAEQELRGFEASRPSADEFLFRSSLADLLLRQDLAPTSSE